MSLLLVLGLGLLAVGGIIYNYANLGPSQDPGEIDMQRVYAPIAWIAGFFLLLVGIFGTATLRKDMDPLGRLLLWMVSFILILLVFLRPSIFFFAP